MKWRLNMTEPDWSHECSLGITPCGKCDMEMNMPALINTVTGEVTWCEIKEGATFNGFYKRGCRQCAGMGYDSRVLGTDSTCSRCNGIGVDPDQSPYKA